jgi:hypothetical protein
MLPVEIVLTLVGLPLGILSSLTYDKIKTFSRHIDSQPFRELFFDSFYKVLQRRDEYYRLLAEAEKHREEGEIEEQKEIEGGGSFWICRIRPRAPCRRSGSI